MEKYEIHTAARRIRRFAVDDLSRFYLKVIKGRDNLQTLHSVYLSLLQLASPIIPFMTESLYKRIYEKKGDESIFLLQWPETDNSKIDTLLETQMEMIKQMSEAANSIRVDTKVKLRWPLAEVIIASKSTEVNAAVNRLSEVLSMLSNVKEIKTEDIEVKLNEEAKSLKDYAKIEELRKKDYLSFLKGRIILHNEEIDYSKYMAVDKKGYSFRIMSWGLILLKTEMDPALYAEAMLSEVRRRIQMMRKEMQLIESDSINVFIDCRKELKQMLEGKIEELKEEVNAKKISFEEGGKLKKKWEIEDEKLEIGISGTK
jgi:isoleucyl-tRNA synthetase